MSFEYSSAQNTPLKTGHWSWLLAFAAGCLALPLLPALPNPLGLGVLILVCLALSFRFRPALLPAAGLAGLLLVTVTAQRTMDQAWPAARDGEVVTVQGTIAGLTEIRGRQIRFDILPLDHHEAGLPRRIRVGWFFPAAWPQAGEEWAMELRLRPPTGRVNPGGFDAERWLLAERIGATATVSGYAVRLDGGRGGLLTRTRQRLAEWLQATTVDLEAAALHRALAVADRGGITQQLGTRLRHTGTAHLLAISGLHVGMVFGVAALLAGWLAAPLSLLHPALDRRRVALLAGLLAAAGYACLAGFTLPTRRALTMLAVVVGAFLLRRGLRPGHALLLALVAVLLIDPLAPLATGFWLSFAAVAVLIWGFAWRPGQSGWLTGLLRAQALIAVGMLPLNVGVFQQLVPVAIPANLLAIPLVGLWILPMLLLAVAAALLGLPGADWPLRLSEYGLVRLLSALEWLDALPAGWWAAAGASGLTLALATLGALWLIAPRGIPARWLGLALLLPLFVQPTDRPARGELDAWVMDAGDGFAVLLQTRHQSWLFDTGRGDGAGNDQVAAVLEPLLRRTGTRTLDGLIVSHDHRSHAGGLHSVLERLHPEIVLSGPGLPFEPCLAGDHWQVDGVKFSVLHPGPGLPDLGGDSACVLAVETAGGRLLIAGAAGTAVGERLARHGPDPRVDMVIARDERLLTSTAFLESSGAEYWVTTAAGEPQNAVPGLLDTGRCGAIRLRFRADTRPGVEAWRERSRRFWRPSCDAVRD